MKPKINPIALIQNTNQGRHPELLAMKYKAMRSDVSMFFRATCGLFHARLPFIGLFKKAPTAWLCGDLHLANFGSYKGSNRLVYFDINDFDEAILAPFTLDLVRILSSIFLAHANEEKAKTACETFIQTYTQTITDGKALWFERDEAQGLVGRLLVQLGNRSRVELLDGMTKLKNKQRVFKCDGIKTLAVTADERDAVMRFMLGFAKSQVNPEFYEVLDVSRRIAGMASLGLPRYAVLVAGKGDASSNYLLDIKAAIPSALSPYVLTKQPKWASQAIRVVAIQKRLQAMPMAFLSADAIDGKPYVVRGLQPKEDKLPILSGARADKQLFEVVSMLAQCVASAHLRGTGRDGSATVDELNVFVQRKKWRRELLDAAMHMSQVIKQDWDVFNQAYDEGAFKNHVA